MQNKVSRLTVDLSLSDHHRIRSAAMILGTTIRKLVVDSFEQYMDNEDNHHVTEEGSTMEQWKSLKKVYGD